MALNDGSNPQHRPVVSTTEARSGVTGHNVRYALITAGAQPTSRKYAGTSNKYARTSFLTTVGLAGTAWHPAA